MKSKILSYFSKKSVPQEKSTLPEAYCEEQLDALILEGQKCEDEGKLDKALGFYQQALEMQPRSARALLNIGNVRCLQENNPAALECYQCAVDFEPENTSALFNLGRLQLILGKFELSRISYQRVLSIKSDWVDAHIGHACALEELNQNDPAIASYRTALALAPAHIGAVINLSRLLLKCGRGVEARELLAEKLQQSPNEIELLTNLAEIERDTGRISEGMARLDRIAELAPDILGTQSVYLFLLNYSPDISGLNLKRAHEKFGQKLESGIVARPQRPRITFDSSRRLKIGYVSPDFSRHPVANFIAPVLSGHDRNSVEIFCYSTGRIEDDVTAILWRKSDHWRSAADWSNEALADAISADKIDILVDLSGHTAGGRLEVFASKPAPVQFTWLGYLGTTGLSRIDYRLCDFHTDPMNLAEVWNTETLARMPDSQWCYDPLRDQPAITPLPRLRNSYWTFGSFNNGRKLNQNVLSAWINLLGTVPDSRLRLYGLQNEDVKRWVRDFLMQGGISNDRMYVSERLSIDEYLKAYGEVDIALDSFPYNSATTMCDAFLCGVPVLAVEGQRSLSRGGVSLLRTLGLSEWIAPSAEALPELAKLLLADTEKIAALREALPGMMRTSPLMDAPRFCQNLEAQYRAAWKKWCEVGSN